MVVLFCVHLKAVEEWVALDQLFSQQLRDFTSIFIAHFLIFVGCFEIIEASLLFNILELRCD